jgi:hypothetical protein
MRALTTEVSASVSAVLLGWRLFPLLAGRNMISSERWDDAHTQDLPA